MEGAPRLWWMGSRAVVEGFPGWDANAGRQKTVPHEWASFTKNVGYWEYNTLAHTLKMINVPLWVSGTTWRHTESHFKNFLCGYIVHPKQEQFTDREYYLDMLLRSAVGMTHSLRSDLWWTIPFQKSTTPILALKLSVSAIITPGGLPHMQPDAWPLALVLHSSTITFYPSSERWVALKWRKVKEGPMVVSFIWKTLK